MIDYKAIYKETHCLSVLLVEDFKPLREEMQILFEDLFAKVVCAENGKEASELYIEAYENNEMFDLVVSDIQMPQMDGVALSKKIRKYNEKQPIIILSAYSETQYLLELINIGISKFITKPIQHETLLDVLQTESIKINSEKKDAKPSNIVLLGEGYRWDQEMRLLTHNHTAIDLTKHELLLLEYFISRKDHICTNMEIINFFYHHTIELSERNVRNLIFKLRRKIPEKCIQSIYGLGYKLVCLNSPTKSSIFNSH